MIKSFKYILMSATFMASFSSCSDSFLDREQDERVDVVRLDQVTQLLSTAYSTGNYGWLSEISSDNVIDINSRFLAPQSNGSDVLVHFNLTSYERADDEAFRFEPVKSSTGTDSPSVIWEGCYNAIATVNHALELLDKIKEKNGGEFTGTDLAVANAAYGEAYLSRAYHHFILTCMFSQAYKNDELSKADVGIPYITTCEDKVLGEYDRGTVTDDYANIQEDLEKGLALISNVNYGNNTLKWHFNVNAAHAFAARFYLYKRDYDKVIEHANAVLTTDPATTETMLMDYSNFDRCTTRNDYANIWQGPNEMNNLMLIATYSTQWRRSVGNRYAYAGPALRDIWRHLGPNWRFYSMPAASVSGSTFYDGNADHGFASTKIAERFEYTDKVSGIGYAHIIRREFTCTELLLNRAEAYLLKENPEVDKCIQDLISYENSRQSFSPANKAFYTSGGALSELTKEKIDSWYVDTSHSNTLADWDFLTNMGFKQMPADNVKYMNAINDMRRYETAYTGLRFFDLKRWGMEYSHEYGPDNVKYEMKWNDPRRAIEVPQEVLAAGMTSSQKPILVPNETKATYCSIPQYTHK